MPSIAERCTSTLNSGGERVPPRVISPASIDSLYLPIKYTLTMEGSNCATATEVNVLAKRLRLELKKWEQSFAAAHHGRRAEREDIKQHPEIGQKLLICYLS